MLNPPNGATSNRISGPATTPSCTPLPYVCHRRSRQGRAEDPKVRREVEASDQAAGEPIVDAVEAHRPICFGETPPKNPGKARKVYLAPTRSFWVLSPSPSVSPKL